jgi:hypothetical protein
VLEKIQKNNEKYPVEKAKGTAKKYDELWWTTPLRLTFYALILRLI